MELVSAEMIINKYKDKKGMHFVNQSAMPDDDLQVTNPLI